MFLNDYDEIPMDALKYLIGQCNYGGRVTDDKDRRLLVCLLSICVCQEIVDDDNHRYNKWRTFRTTTFNWMKLCNFAC